MDRTVPKTGSEEIALYVRTYYTLLRSTREVPIKTLLEAHTRISSALHVHAHNPNTLDMSAFTYSILRLPDCLNERVNLVVMGQSEHVFAQHGYPHIETWQSVNAPARRRRTYWDGHKTLAVFIASRSDIDDLIPMLVAYQIERDKLHYLLNRTPVIHLLEAHQSHLSLENLHELSNLTGIDIEDLDRLRLLWGDKLATRLLHIARKKISVAIRLLAGSFAEYKRATRRWWENIAASLPHLTFYDQPIYFISSNTHSLPNLLSGYTQSIEPELTQFIQNCGDVALQQEYEDILKENVPSSHANLLYYVLKKFEANFPERIADRLAYEKKYGIHRIESKHVFDVEAQLVELNKLDPNQFDPRLKMDGLEQLSQTNALIINIDYPLGMAAYQILSEIARNIAEIRGVYIMGKAATLNGRIGDVMIPNVVHDEHSQNTYMFNNCFAAGDIVPHLVYGSVLDNQKAITVQGTFLQNHEYMAVFYNEGYTDLEMEAGPYLSCVYELIRPRRYPYNEVVNLYQAPFEIGVLHYASDTPFSKGKNLGAQNLSYFGMDPTYASMIAILRTIEKSELAEASREKPKGKSKKQKAKSEK